MLVVRDALAPEGCADLGRWRCSDPLTPSLAGICGRRQFCRDHTPSARLIVDVWTYTTAGGTMKFTLCYATLGDPHW